jgi:hypothetical protein
MTVHAVWAELESFEEETLQYITVECIKIIVLISNTDFEKYKMAELLGR